MGGRDSGRLQRQGAGHSEIGGAQYESTKPFPIALTLPPTCQPRHRLPSAAPPPLPRTPLVHSPSLPPTPPLPLPLSLPPLPIPCRSRRCCGRAGRKGGRWGGAEAGRAPLCIFIMPLVFQDARGGRRTWLLLSGGGARESKGRGLGERGESLCLAGNRGDRREGGRGGGWKSLRGGVEGKGSASEGRGSRGGQAMARRAGGGRLGADGNGFVDSRVLSEVFTVTCRFDGHAAAQACIFLGYTAFQLVHCGFLPIAAAQGTYPRSQVQAPTLLGHLKKVYFNFTQF